MANCDTCKFYSNCNICSTCVEGSEYVLETIEYYEARKIVSKLIQKEAAIPYDGDYADNTKARIWYQVNTEEELNAVFTLYGEILTKERKALYKLPDYICVFGCYKDLEDEEYFPDLIKQETAETTDYLIYSLHEAEKTFNEMKTDLIGEQEEHIILLNDLSEDTTDAVIIAKISTAKDVEKAIQSAKAEKEYDWQFEDLVEALPKDCRIVSRWSGIEKAYY